MVVAITERVGANLSNICLETERIAVGRSMTSPRKVASYITSVWVVPPLQDARDIPHRARNMPRSAQVFYRNPVSGHHLNRRLTRREARESNSLPLRRDSSQAAATDRLGRCRRTMAERIGSVAFLRYRLRSATVLRGSGDQRRAEVFARGGELRS